MSGTGKSSLINGLHNFLHCDILSVGEILRATFSPRAISESNIPEDNIFRIVSKKMSSVTTNLTLIDNFPINEIQLDAWLKCYPMPLIVFLLEIAEPRNLNRGRLDDNPVIQATRKLQFLNQTLPIIGYMEHRQLVIRLDGSKPRRELVQESLNYIRQKFITQNINFCDGTLLITQKQTEASTIPTKKYPFSAGYDISLPKSIIISPHRTEVHSTSVSIELGARTVGIIFNRSSTASRGIHIHSGVIDPCYTDSVKIIISNLTADPVFIDHEVPIAQIIIFPIFCPQIIDAVTIKTPRSGFGSSNNG